MLRFGKPLLWSVLAINVWVLLIHLVANVDIGSMSLTAPEAMLGCALLVLAPAMIFLPLASRLRAPFYDTEAILGWGTLGFVLVFFTPSEPLTHGQFLALLLPLTVSIASVAMLIAYAFVRRLRPDIPASLNLVQARRIGYLAALTLVALTLLNALQLLTPFNGTLVVAVAVLAELLVLASWRPSFAAD